MSRQASRRIAAFLTFVLLAAMTPVVAPVSVAYAGSLSANLTCVTFPTASIGYAAGENGTIRKSTDGGATWTLQTDVDPSIGTKKITGIAFWDEIHGIVVTADRSVYGTDNGSKWLLRNADMTEFQQGEPDIRVNGVVAVPGTAYMGVLAAGDRLPGEYPPLGPQLWGHQIAPAGGFWGQMPDYEPKHPYIDEQGATLFEALGDFIGLDFVDSTHGWAVGVDTWVGADVYTGIKSDPQAIVAKSTDGGLAWQKQTLPVSTATLKAISFADVNAGVAVGTGGTVFYTTNGGGLWSKGTSGVSSSTLNGVAMASSTQGWAVGDGGVALRTGDGGATWTPRETGTFARLNAIDAVGASGVAVAVGAGGTIVRTSDGTTWALVGAPTSVSTALTLAASSVVYYNVSATLTGTLKTTLGDPVVGQSVKVQVSTNGTSGWTDFTGNTAVTDANGAYSVKSPVLTTKRYFRTVFAGATGYEASMSPVKMILPKTWLSYVYASSTMYRNRAYTVYGYLKPKHTAGTYAAEVQAWRYESGKWVLRKTVWAKASNYKYYSKLTASLSLPYAGNWKIRFRHKADAANALNYSTVWKYVTVK